MWIWKGVDGEITFETWQPPENVMLFESISNCLHFETYQIIKLVNFGSSSHA